MTTNRHKEEMQNDHKETQKRRNIKQPPGDTKPPDRVEKQP